MRFETVGSEGELVDAEVTCILQDRTGFVWLGTYANGLYRFDGHELRHYASDPEDPTTLSSNSIWALAEDGEGFVWVGTWGSGLCRFDPRLQKFTRFRHVPGDPESLSDDTIATLLLDSNGTFWVGTFKGGLTRLERRRRHLPVSR
jgi:ligand-binding sensor domain-containing protein